MCKISMFEFGNRLGEENAFTPPVSVFISMNLLIYPFVCCFKNDILLFTIRVSALHQEDISAGLYFRT